MTFNTYVGNETLRDQGFQVFKNDSINNIASNAIKNLEALTQYVDNSDVFRTKLGDIKQIQNLHKSFSEPINSYFGNFNQICANLIGKHLGEVEILNNQYFCKPPNYKMTSAHQDNAYFESEEKVYTFWMPLQDVDILNSCMFYVPGSHLKGLVPHDPIGTNTRVRTGKKGVSLYSSFYKNKDFVKVPMNKGEIVVHDKNCMHFSSPNLSDDYRIAITSIMKVY